MDSRSRAERSPVLPPTPPSLSLSLGSSPSLPLSPPPNSAPRLPNSQTFSWSSVRASLKPQDCRAAAPEEKRTMGRQERGWVVCLSFLGFVASVESVTRGELFPFGPSAGDQTLEAGNDQTHRLELDNPVLFYDGTFSSIFVSYLVVGTFWPWCRS